MSNYVKAKKLNVAQQRLRMKSLHPQFELNELALSRAAWVGLVKPSPLSESYLIRISYEMYDRPRVFVLFPKLKRREDNQPIPHTYQGKELHLCLYYPRANEWHAGKYIADTILPWISLWLFYYEAWHSGVK